jgi:hypothetical protein
MAIIKPNNNTLSSITALPAAISTGKVLQVQSLYTANQQTTTSTSFIDVTGMSKSIIPSSTSNKVLVNICFYAAAIPSSKPYFRLMRDSTNLATISQDSITSTFAVANPSSPDTDRDGETFGFTFLDSPNSSSSVTYKLTMATGNSSYTAYFGRRDINTNTNQGATITLMEIAE